MVAGEFTIEGEEHLSDLDDARLDSVIRVLTGLVEMPSSRRMGEFSFRDSVLDGFQELAVYVLVGFGRRWLQVVVVISR